MIYLNITIPFEKLLPFKTNIAEVCSISLEHDVSINDNELLGDFIISGEYKNLDVNVDTYPFEHVIPFSVDLEEDILIDTLNYEVEDFTYDIVNNDTLKVKIILHVTADKKLVDLKEDIFEKEPEIKIEDRLDLIDDIKPNNVEEKSNTIEDKVDIINNTNIKEDYITYHIHFVKINETIDSICSEYKIEKEKLLELNDITTIDVGDKIIIPDVDEQ
jgi:hypothetical protein